MHGLVLSSPLFEAPPSIHPIHLPYDARLETTRHDNAKHSLIQPDPTSTSYPYLVPLVPPEVPSYMMLTRLTTDAT